MAGDPSKVILIAGGTSGVGYALMERALNNGYRVFVTGTDQGRLGRALQAGEQDRLDGILADISDWEQTRDAVERAVSRFGRLDALVVSAGRGAEGNLADGDPEAWRTMVLTNVLGPALMIRGALEPLEASRGQVVLIGSVFGRKAVSGNLYSSTKWAVTGMGESLRQQVVGSGIRVCVVHPGRIDTPWWPEGAPPPALSADAVASCVTWVLEQPTDVDVNEIVVRPTGAQL